MTKTGLDVTDCDRDRSHGSPLFEKERMLVTKLVTTGYGKTGSAKEFALKIASK